MTMSTQWVFKVMLRDDDGTLTSVAATEFTMHYEPGVLAVAPEDTMLYCWDSEEAALNHSVYLLAGAGKNIRNKLHIQPFELWLCRTEDTPVPLLVSARLWEDAREFWRYYNSPGPYPDNLELAILNPGSVGVKALIPWEKRL